MFKQKLWQAKWISDQGCTGLLLLWRGFWRFCLWKRLRWYVGMHRPKRPPWKRHRGARCCSWGCGGRGWGSFAWRSVFCLCFLVVYVPLQRFTEQCYRFLLCVEFHIVLKYLRCAKHLKHAPSKNKNRRQKKPSLSSYSPETQRVLKKVLGWRVPFLLFLLGSRSPGKGVKLAVQLTGVKSWKWNSSCSLKIKGKWQKRI